MQKDKRIWFKDLRKEKNLTLKELSEIVQCSEPHLCDIENGKKTPSFKLAYKLSKELNFDIENFFHETISA